MSDPHCNSHHRTQFLLANSQFNVEIWRSTFTDLKTREFITNHVPALRPCHYGRLVLLSILSVIQLVF